MENKNASVTLIVKFLISTVMAFLVFYFIMYKACSFVPLINDRAESTINELEEQITSLSSGGVSGVRMTLVLPKNKAFFFFENSSKKIEMHRTKIEIKTGSWPKENSIYVMNRPIGYCDTTKPCFCYCDKLELKIDEKCNRILECKRAKIACTSFDEKFSFQQDKEAFFNDTNTEVSLKVSWESLSFSRQSTRLVFEGGFLISPEHNLIQSHVDRVPLVLQKKGDVIHICSKTGDCLIEDRTSVVQDQLNVNCN
jgi:hypothetical protein